MLAFSIDLQKWIHIKSRIRKLQFGQATLRDGVDRIAIIPNFQRLYLIWTISIANVANIAIVANIENVTNIDKVTNIDNVANIGIEERWRAKWRSMLKLSYGEFVFVSVCAFAMCFLLT